jgi:hypothetical protein
MVVVFGGHRVGCRTADGGLASRLVRSAPDELLRTTCRRSAHRDVDRSSDWCFRVRYAAWRAAAVG